MDIVEGDRVEVTIGSIATKSMDVNVQNVGSIDPVNNQVTGHLVGGEYPAAGRVDVWHAQTNSWYYQNILIDAGGNFAASFNGLVYLSLADRARVWYITPTGNEIAWNLVQV